jgi:hypothetical protein
MYSLALLNIIYSYKYLESDLIKHFSRDIYPFVGSTAGEEIPRDPHMFPRQTIESHSNKGDNWYIISNIFASDTK